MLTRYAAGDNPSSIEVVVGIQPTSVRVKPQKILCDIYVTSGQPLNGMRIILFPNIARQRRPNVFK